MVQISLLQMSNLIKCRWCQDELIVSGSQGYKSCSCKSVSVDIGNGYYRVIANFEDIDFQLDSE